MDAKKYERLAASPAKEQQHPSPTAEGMLEEGARVRLMEQRPYLDAKKYERLAASPATKEQRPYLDALVIALLLYNTLTHRTISPQDDERI